MMTSTSKSNRRKSNKSKFLPKPKQQWQVKEQKRNWLELPNDVMANILYRAGVYDIIENAQKVCTTWRAICKDPAMWRVINMDNSYREPNDFPPIMDLCKIAVDRSQGQLIDIIFSDFAYEELLEYIADRSSQLRRLNIRCCEIEFLEIWAESLKKFPLLEELSLCKTEISKEAIETLGRYCPMLRTLKVNGEAEPCDLWYYGSDDETESLRLRNEIAIAIGENLSELRHLELIGNNMSNTGLKLILDGCHNLELLDLRQCLFLDLDGDMGKTCLEKKIKCLKLPNDSLEDHPYLNGNDDFTHDLYFDYADYSSELIDSDDDYY